MYGLLRLSFGLTAEVSRTLIAAFVCLWDGALRFCTTFVSWFLHNQQHNTVVLVILSGWGFDWLVVGYAEASVNHECYTLIQCPVRFSDDISLVTQFYSVLFYYIYFN